MALSLQKYLLAAGVDSREWSWGANFFDFDLDGFQDLYLAAGAMNTFEAYTVFQSGKMMAMVRLLTM